MRTDTDKEEIGNQSLSLEGLERIGVVDTEVFSNDEV